MTTGERTNESRLREWQRGITHGDWSSSAHRKHKPRTAKRPASWNANALLRYGEPEAGAASGASSCSNTRNDYPPEHTKAPDPADAVRGCHPERTSTDLTLRPTKSGSSLPSLPRSRCGRQTGPPRASTFLPSPRVCNPLGSSRSALAPSPRSLPLPFRLHTPLGLTTLRSACGRLRRRTCEGTSGGRSLSDLHKITDVATVVNGRNAIPRLQFCNVRMAFYLLTDGALGPILTIDR